MEQTLKAMATDMFTKAEERGCNMVCIVEREDEDGYHIAMCGATERLTEMLCQASEESAMFREVLDKAKKNPLAGNKQYS